MDKKELLKKAIWAFGNYGVELYYGEGEIIKLDTHNLKPSIIDLEDGDCKILLNPLECLTEEIEHPVTGEKFVPFERLKEIFVNEENGYDVNKFITTEFGRISCPIPELMSHRVVEYLKEWHINYMNLPKEFCRDKREVK